MCLAKICEPTTQPPLKLCPPNQAKFLLHSRDLWVDTVSRIQIPAYPRTAFGTSAMLGLHFRGSGKGVFVPIKRFTLVGSLIMRAGSIPPGCIPIQAPKSLNHNHVSRHNKRQTASIGQIIRLSAIYQRERCDSLWSVITLMKTPPEEVKKGKEGVAGRESSQPFRFRHKSSRTRNPPRILASLPHHGYEITTIQRENPRQFGFMQIV